MATKTASGLVIGAIASGIGCGWLLASISSIAACSAYPQRTFAILQLVLVMLAVVLYFSLPRILAAHGVAAAFAVLGACPIIVIPVLQYLPVRAPASRESQSQSRHYQRGLKWKAISVLLALGIVIASQTALMASAMDLGGTIGLGGAAAGTLMSIAAILCLLAPLGARILGDKSGLLVPLVTSTFVLALASAFLTHAYSSLMFFSLLTAVMGLPLFIAPYALAVLAKFGGAGQWAAVGPGFMMGGAAIGPSLGGFIRYMMPLDRLGDCMALTIAAAAIVFALAHARMTPQIDRVSPS